MSCCTRMSDARHGPRSQAMVVYWCSFQRIITAKWLLSGLLQCTVRTAAMQCNSGSISINSLVSLTKQIRGVWGITCGLACVQSLTTAHSWLLLWAVAMLLEGVGPLRCQRRRCCGAPSPGARGKSGWASACRCWRAQLLHELWLVLRVSYGPACMSVCVQQHSCVVCVCEARRSAFHTYALDA